MAIEVETFAGKVYVEWDPTAAVTPIGQLPFLIEFLKLGHRFQPWVEQCPLPTLFDAAGLCPSASICSRNRSPLNA